MQYLGDYFPTTRGLRNNNPFNIKRGEKWQGAVPAGLETDKVFVQFTDISYGVRAAIKILRSYQRQGMVSVASIINRWAPPSENNTNGYVSFICLHSGLTPYATLSKTQYLKLMQQMAVWESNVHFTIDELTAIYDKVGVELG